MAENHPRNPCGRATVHVERLNDLDGSRFDRRWRGSAGWRLGRNLERAKNPCGGTGRGGIRDGYAPGKRWSPSAVGRKRKYWDWFSRTRDRASTLGTQRELPTMWLLLLLPPPPSSFCFATKAVRHHRFLVLLLLRGWGQIPSWTRREPRCAIHFCPLTSFPRLPRRVLAGSRTPVPSERESPCPRQRRRHAGVNPLIKGQDRHFSSCSILSFSLVFRHYQLKIRNFLALSCSQMLLEHSLIM